MMTYEYGKRGKTTKHLVGFAIVILLHIIVLYFVLTSSFRVPYMTTPKALQIVEVIEEKKPVIPEPPIEEPVMREVVPQFVPPPPIIVQEVKIAQVNLEAIKSVTFVDKAPIVVPTYSGTGPVTNKPIIEAPIKVNNSVGVACPNSQTIRATMEYPREARRQNVTGDVLVKFTVTSMGTIEDVVIVASASRLLNAAAIAAVNQFKCVGQNRNVVVEVPFSFNLTD